MELKKVKVIGTGSGIPSSAITNHYISRLVETDDEWIRQRTGIQERRWASEWQSTSDLCVEAANNALQVAAIKKEEIDLLIVATVTPDYHICATSAIVQQKLGLANVGGYEIVSACSGFVNSFQTAWQFLRTGVYKTALVIGAETLSRIINMTDRGTVIIFGDGAGAAILKAYEGEGPSDILHCSMGQDGTGVQHLKVPAGGSAEPASFDSLEKHRLCIEMDGKAIYKFAVRKMAELIDLELKSNNWKPEDVDIIIPHQVNMRILESAAEKVGISTERMLINIDKYGNTSAASVPQALDEAYRTGRLKRGNKVIMVAFGAGLTWSSVSMIW